MNWAMTRNVLIGLAVLALTACSDLNTKDGANGAKTEDHGVSGSEMSDIDRAKARGLGAEGGAGAAELNDPNSPLATRVIYFDYDSANIRADFQNVVQAHAQYLSKNAGTSITLEGHTDERGSREYNLALGERRAQAVRKQLVLLGASAQQIQTVSYGEERPVSDGHDEQAYSLNRRVEIKYH
jgi:peptidoglycan-associated lipoprotein